MKSEVSLLSIDSRLLVYNLREVSTVLGNPSILILSFYIQLRFPSPVSLHTFLLYFIGGLIQALQVVIWE
jgi:hypothetical protein